MQHVQNPAHAFFGVVLHMAHIGVDRLQPELPGDFAQLGSTCLIGRNLCGKICHVLISVAARILTRAKKRARLGLAQPSLVNQMKVVNQNTFFVDPATVRRRRSRRLTTDIRVMPTAGDGIDHLRTRLGKDRCDHRDIRQMRAAV